MVKDFINPMGNASNVISLIVLPVHLLVVRVVNILLPKIMANVTLVDKAISIMLQHQLVRLANHPVPIVNLKLLTVQLVVRDFNF